VSRWDYIKRTKDAAKAKIDETDFGKVAGDAVLGASNLVDGVESVAQRSGLTKKNGEISKFKAAKAAVQPRKTARRLFDATADDVRARREASGENPTSDD
jgi:hypothetical protein